MELRMRAAASACLIAAILGCEEPPKPIETPKPVEKARRYPPIRRFENVSPLGSAGVALDTATGQWCRTWEWEFKDASRKGALDTLPTCLSLYEETQSEDKENPPNP